MPTSQMWKYCNPKKGIVNCLECGHPKEASVICPQCYSKVREETLRLQGVLGGVQADVGHADGAAQEVEFVYDGEVFGAGSHNKVQVRVDGPRPAWFSKSLPERRR